MTVSLNLPEERRHGDALPSAEGLDIFSKIV